MIFSDSFDFYEQKNKVVIASKDMLLSLLFGFDYNPNLSDLSTVIDLINTYSNQPIVQKEVLKLENLISELLLDHVLTKQLTFITNHVIQGNLLELTVECHNKSNYIFQDFCYDIKWKPENFIDRFKVEGFKSLVKSSELLVKIMEKLGIIEGAEEAYGIVEIKLGHARQIFINNDSIECCLFAMRNMDNNLVLTKLDVYNPYQRFDTTESVEVIDLPQFDMVFRTYSKGKGPPFKR